MVAALREDLAETQNGVKHTGNKLPANTGERRALEE
jgi:hypothetical protein